MNGETSPFTPPTVDTVAQTSDRLARTGMRFCDHQLVDEFVDGDVFRNVLGAGAVVRQEDDHRVVDLP